MPGMHPAIAFGSSRSAHTRSIGAATTMVFSMSTHLLRRSHDRFYNSRITRAPAKIAVQPAAYVLLGRVRALVQHRHRDNHETRRAIATLKPAVLDEGLLYRMQNPIDSKTLHGCDLVAVGLHGK